MKNNLHKIIMLTCVIILSLSFKIKAQVCEWRLVNPKYSIIDPDGAGPAKGSVKFTLQIHTTSGTINNINAIATGWSYQSGAAMIPTTPGCATVSNPANVTVSASFTGFTYNTVNQCAAFSQTTGGQTFDRTATGSLTGTVINLTTTWVDVFTVTLWTLGTTPPEGGYVIINSSSLGSPGPLSTYSVSDNAFTEYAVNSLTYTTPLPLSSLSALPVLFTNFEANCTNNGTLISWATASEFNSDYFEVQRSTNANDWTQVATVKASGNSAAAHTYHQLDLDGGAAFYRIKQVDIDGHFIYTNIIRTNCDIKKMSMVVYPVPAQNILNVVIKSDRYLKTQLMLIDGVGKIVQKINTTLFNGSNSFTINLNGLSTGEYLIRSSDPGVDLNKRFNIIR